MWKAVGLQGSLTLAVFMNTKLLSSHLNLTIVTNLDQVLSTAHTCLTHPLPSL